ncbi:LppP/LprE family lipoprotein [Nocardia lijiangensis]|uniref:LppP/LprE family lipoprotein n=1 Tax=Nocardia lijiangensis TaxID=299618 RepID=UPI000A939F47|nr:LppP/LprE family lipoprotein [Nocardia lijiangensis]
MNHMVRMAALIATAAALAAGCSSDDSAQPTPSSQRTTVGAASTPGATTAPAAPGPQTPGEAATPAPGTNPPPAVTEAPQQPGPSTPVVTTLAPTDDIGGPGRCIDPASAGVRTALAGLGEGWAATQASADQPGSCGQLLWVRAVGGNSAGAPIHVMFFHDGKYLGTATSEPYAFTHVAGSNGNSVNVGYRWLVADEPFAAPQGGPVTITYTWTGSGVAMSDPLPKEVTQPHR